MTKKFFFICLVSFVLAACSEKVDQPESTKTDSASTTAEQVELDNNIETNSEEIDSTEISETTDEEDIEDEVTEVAKTETSVDEIVEEKVTEETTETVQTSLQTVDKDIDYYDYYQTTAVAKSDEVSSSELDAKVSESKTIVYEQLSDNLIQFPLLQDNEVHFEENDIQRITLAQLEEINAVEYYEEPLTRGYLIDINLSILKEHYLGHSYSFEYDGNEYGVIISKNAKEYGFVFLKDVEGLLEEIKKQGRFNILN